MAKLFVKSFDYRASTVMATVLRDESNSISLRKRAYRGLCQIQGIESPAFLISMFRAKHALPADIDWELVNRFYE